ncbi:Trm112 family protein [Glaciecola sp. XM2]|jgi:uncharacterized protein YbaR (Trm112 family)|uniref:Trm112 family protein n=1 Tax=Glaciecola sp. XM2 TaxID=1914931 RepID=UPI001BDE702F|nr:Trm112 family protein [Glaciecola sp. XM2]MBT1452006.1 Trm112 family protein [Glaciecola sp. XM2]
MAFNKKLLDILACPTCKGQLVLHDVPSDSTDENTPVKQELVCRFDRLAYAIEDGIPVLLESESRTMSAEEFESVKAHD